MLRVLGSPFCPFSIGFDSQLKESLYTLFMLEGIIPNPQCPTPRSFQRQTPNGNKTQQQVLQNVCVKSLYTTHISQISQYK